MDKFIEFERQYGTLESYEAAVKRVKPRRQQLVEAVAVLDEKKTSAVPDRKKRKQPVQEADRSRDTIKKPRKDGDVKAAANDEDSSRSVFISNIPFDVSDQSIRESFPEARAKSNIELLYLPDD